MTRARRGGVQAPSFANLVVRWQSRYGRHDLPWQTKSGVAPDPYRVWLSEVMLQQTQVSTVLGYFERFVERFPNVQALAAASVDDVLALWTGLGYYSRARNLHRCAQVVVKEHAGLFPRSAQALEALPGIGRSTAAAIASTCAGERVAILDGNVKRVVARVTAFEGDLGQAKAVGELWGRAEGLLPTGSSDMRAYTQGMMDLGALVCKRTKPNCAGCPVQAHCAGHASGAPERYPVRKKRLTRQTLSLWWLVLRRGDGAVWLERRPANGIWASLYGFPTWDSWEAMQSALPSGWPQLARHEPPKKHVLTHRDLFLHPVHVQLDGPPNDPSVAAFIGQRSCGAWYQPHDWKNLGMPQPVLKSLLEIQ